MMSSCAASQILVLALESSYSHWIFITNILDELVKNGHKLTTITPYSRYGAEENYKEYQINEYYWEGNCKILSLKLTNNFL